jgi:hypothetical protein
VTRRRQRLAPTRVAAFAALLTAAAVAAPAAAQSAAIYACVDAKGRKITSDRPIPECIDREQRQLSRSGMVTGRLPPSPTAAERAAQEEQARHEAAQALQVEQNRRRDRSLLVRYPTPDHHARERASALARVDELLVVSRKRWAELEYERQALQLAAVKSQDPADQARLQRAIDDNRQHLAAQQRLVDSHSQERQRLDSRFGEEESRLRLLWPASTGRVAPAAAPAPAPTAAASAAR